MFTVQGYLAIMSLLFLLMSALAFNEGKKAKIRLLLSILREKELSDDDKALIRAIGEKVK